ncbi:hypothetical protein P7D50_09920 [Enterococcus dongliensis]|uniref:hypothetical protein n=1 Tax=Enterococcus dongliensis TaxID=2559925 RepID=UPI00288C7A12|nr:hypothetical protein [Enterococcus dongliensis]MDT2648114.1 hypothetical protein [Enterococcus dongliensis]
MKDKPQMIRTTIDGTFINQYVEMLIPAIKRKFNIRAGIEGPLFMDRSGSDEMIIRFLANDDQAQEVYEFINSKWQFESEPQLVS